MADIFTPEKRSQIMSRVKSRNTALEQVVYKHLRKKRIYFQKHYRTKLGITPDIVLPRKKKAIFIDSDFWHGRFYTKDTTRLNPYWRGKIERNIERDAIQSKLLTENGWTVMRIWGLELTKKSTYVNALKRITNFLEDTVR